MSINAGMKEQTRNAFMRLRAVCAANELSPDMEGERVVVNLGDLRLVVGWMWERDLSANSNITAEKAADYDAIVRLLSRGLKGG